MGGIGEGQKKQEKGRDRICSWLGEETEGPKANQKEGGHLGVVLSFLEEAAVILRQRVSRGGGDKAITPIRCLGKGGGNRHASEGGSRGMKAASS